MGKDSPEGEAGLGSAPVGPRGAGRAPPSPSPSPSLRLGLGSLGGPFIPPPLPRRLHCPPPPSHPVPQSTTQAGSRPAIFLLLARRCHRRRRLLRRRSRPERERERERETRTAGTADAMRPDLARPPGPPLRSRLRPAPRRAALRPEPEGSERASSMSGSSTTSATRSGRQQAGGRQAEAVPALPRRGLHPLPSSSPGPHPTLLPPLSRREEPRWPPSRRPGRPGPGPGGRDSSRFRLRAGGAAEHAHYAAPPARGPVFPVPERRVAGWPLHQARLAGPEGCRGARPRLGSSGFGSCPPPPRKARRF